MFCYNQSGGLLRHFVSCLIMHFAHIARFGSFKINGLELLDLERLINGPN